MNAKYKIILFVACFLIFEPQNLKALTKSEYQTRSVCGENTYEIARANPDGSASHIACHSTFARAHEEMANSQKEDYIIFERKNGKTTLVDAQYALLDLTVNPKATTYYYADEKDETTPNNYMDNGSLYGGVDGAFVEVNQPNKVAHLKVAGYDGWVNPEDYEIVPLNWVKSGSSYTVTNEYIKHNYVINIQNEYQGSLGRVIGMKPSMLAPGTYYSYDGKYFYTNRLDMLNDYKRGAHNQAVNSEKPYYNYYLYLPNHSKTSYSSTNIDTYIRDGLGYTKDVYGNVASSKTSRLYGKGTFFYYAQQKYGVNAVLSLSLSRNETGNGTSNLAVLKNNGFGLNAVDSNPYEDADWYPSFASSILGYASRWITYGYANPFDYRYRSNVFGHKGIGMGVKYASDPYWSEKMASNYYALDSYYGLQDYNYYQLGVSNTQGIVVRNAPRNNATGIYHMNYLDTSCIIIDEVEGDNVGGSTKWYKIISDLNIDSNGNALASYNDYNWDGAYVYVPAVYITKINSGKNGYISPTEVTPFQDSRYSYDLYTAYDANIEATIFKPKVAYTTKNSDYYYDSTLTTKMGSTVLKNKYVMVYNAAFNADGKAVSYLITSNYKYDQKHWVDASSIKFVSSDYGRETVNLKGQYAWVNYNTVDSSKTVISGQYDGSYFPILDIVNTSGKTWYKIPVNLEGENDSYGYILKNDSASYVETFHSDKSTNDEIASANTAPTIMAENKEILQKSSFDAKAGVTAFDKEDGDLTSKIIVVSNNVDTNKIGTYTVLYRVIDSAGEQTEKKITVDVVKNEDPIFYVDDQEITVGDSFDPYQNIKVEDKEDGNLTNTLEVVKNSVDTSRVGSYEVTYCVTTKQNEKFTKTIIVKVVEDMPPVIEAYDKVIVINKEFNPLLDVSAFDKEDGDLTKNVQVIANNVNTKKAGVYSVLYQVSDSANHLVTKEISVTVLKKELVEKDGEFYLEELHWDKEKQKYRMNGYLKIIGINNTKEEDINYELVLVSKTDVTKTYSIPVQRQLKDFPFEVESENGKDYTYSWFDGYLDFSSVLQDDYSLYMKASTEDYYTYQVVNNIMNNSVDRRAEDDSKGYSFKVNLNLKIKSIDLSIRNGNLITSSFPKTYRNMINNYDSITFEDNKLHLIGTSYNYGESYANKNDIKRTLYLENVKTFKQYSFDLGSTKDGGYVVSATDGKSKEYVWYDQKIDISKLEKGTYSLQVYTKVANTEDYGEIVDIFGSIEEPEITMNNKKYKIILNKERQNRIELVVS